MADGMVQVKSEPSEPLDLERKFIQLCQENPNGITNELLKTELPNVDSKQIATAINRLISQGKVDILKKGEQLLYKLKDPEAAKKVKGADSEEKIVYRIIQESGNKGIWTRDIRFKSNLSLAQVNKILRNLESKKLIKAVKSVSASKKKVYMLYNLEPDRSVSGGAWYSDQEFDAEYVEVLNQQCLRFLKQKADRAREKHHNPVDQTSALFASSKEVLEYITELGISKDPLEVGDIEAILNTVIYDGKCEKTVVASAAASTSANRGLGNWYRPIDPLIKCTGLMRSPCSVCPVFEDCNEGGAISPSNCQYMKEWLEY